ncbi:MAG: hypothetical protein AAF351_05365 [Pseudomonadota bacterium]
MTKEYWRETVEVVGVIAVVVSLLILAAEVRQSNQIARVDTAASLLNSFNAIHVQRASNPEFAKLFPKMEDPEAHLITATDASQIRGIAHNYMNVWRNAQVAYINGLVDEDTFQNISNSVYGVLIDYPGLAPHIIAIYEASAGEEKLEIFAPVGRYIDAQNADFTHE